MLERFFKSIHKYLEDGSSKESNYCPKLKFSDDEKRWGKKNDEKKNRESLTDSNRNLHLTNCASAVVVAGHSPPLSLVRT